MMFQFPNTFPPEMAVSHCQPPVKEYAASVLESVVHHFIPRKSTRPNSQHKQDAKASRALEFSLGRQCADTALVELGCKLPSSSRTVGVNDDRSPIWPKGFVGSISHSCNWTWAAVAYDLDVAAVGIDTEPIITTDTMRQVIPEITTKAEWDFIKGSKNRLDTWTDEEKATLIFSAKEAFYKCWFPLHRTYFGFLDAKVDRIDPDRIRIGNSSTSPNRGKGPEFLDVFFYKSDSDLFSFTWMTKE